MTESSLQALAILRRTDNMQWYVVPLLVFVIYIYVNEVEKKNWSAVLLGIAMWAGELIWEMFNAAVLHFSGYAPLWCAPGKSAFVLYAGLNIEIAFFFAIAGVIIVKSLPADRNLKIFGISNRIVIPTGFGLFAVFVETLLNQCNLLIWDYGWWGWPHVWLIAVVYCSPFLLLAWCHDHMTLQTKARWAVALPIAALVCHVFFANILGWV